MGSLMSAGNVAIFVSAEEDVEPRLWHLLEIIAEKIRCVVVGGNVHSFEVSLDKVLVRDPDTKIRLESFGSIVVSRNNPTICLNESAVFLFDLCDGQRSVKDVVIFAADKLGVAPDSVADKIITTLSWMWNTGILKSKDDIS